MATFYYRRKDTGDEVGISGHGRKHAQAMAAVKLGLRADQLHLLENYWQKGSVKPHHRAGKKPKEERRKRAPVSSGWSNLRW